MTVRPAFSLVAAMVGLALGLALAASGCTTDPPPERKSALRQVSCPEDVATAVVGGAVDCAYLTVPESRSTGDGLASDRRVEVFVAMLDAGDAAEGREPVLVTSLGSTPNYGGIAPLAQRVGRDVVIVDTRGTAHSLPQLDCPEVQEVDRFADDVARCFERLSAEGIDVSAYDGLEAARDIEDLRVELGVDRWNVASYGAGSRVALELLRIAPDRVRALYLDSPEVPAVDPRRLAGPETVSALRDVLASCADDDACAARYPQAEGLLDRAMRALDREPARLTVKGHEGDVVVRLDPPLLARFLRQLLSDASKGPFFRPTTAPAVLTAVMQRRWSMLRPALGLALLYGDPVCAGYRPFCLPAHRPYLGVELTVLCRDVAPFAPTSGSDLPLGFRDAFGAGPWHDACAAWPVDPAPATLARAPDWDGPVLVATGRYDPYTDDGAVRQALAGLTNVSYVVDPAFGYNPTPRPCVSGVRNGWLDKPAPFADNPCAHEEGLRWDE